MPFNPFEEKPKKLFSTLMDWKTMSPKPYNKNAIEPYTKTRIILAAGAEYEAVWFGHSFSRHCANNEIRREIALSRRIEQQQQKRIAALKPLDENLLETTIAYEQLAVDLTAFMAQRSTNKEFKAGLDFALLEDFDHLYRYADMLDHDMGIKAETLVGKYTEIMPGRPTIAHHRHPYDDIKNPTNMQKVDIQTTIDAHIITAAEQQTMNYYMNQAAFYHTEAGRKLYTEIGMVEEQHVSQYGSFLDPNVTMLECNLIHEYVECYLYWSLVQDETNSEIKKIWEQCLEQEIAHLHNAVGLLEKYEHKSWQELFPKGASFPDPLHLGENKEYVRKVLAKTVNNTANKEGYIDASHLERNADFFKYQNVVNKQEQQVASHQIISTYISKHGEDYRYEEKPHPVKALRNRKEDNIYVGRK